MRKWMKTVPVLAVGAAALLAGWGVTSVQAAKADTDLTIADGIYIGEVNVGGMTAVEAEDAVNDYVQSLSDETVTLSVNGNTLEPTVEALGLDEDVETTVSEAVNYGRTGNLVERYKEKKDLEQGDKVLPLVMTVDGDKVKAYLEEHAPEVNQDAVDYGLTRENGEFVVIEGKDGVAVDVDGSVQVIADYFAEGWTADANIELAVQVTKPQGSAEELAKVQDVLGTFSTKYSSSARGRKKNVATGTELINGSVIYPGETFSVYEAVSPFSEENGYALAGSYENGTTVQTYGGGICQVSTTLYNAVIRAELEIEERYGHSMIVNYVDPSADAAIAGTVKDLKFKNNTDAPIYIEGTADGSTVSFTVYGQETRPSNREISFVSETTGTTPATTEFKATDAPIGTVNRVQSAHEGSTAQLWKVVTVDGVEQSRELFNKTTYKMSPTIYEVGTSSGNAEAVAAIKAAIATNDLNTIKAAAAQWNDEALQKAAAEKAAQDAQNQAQPGTAENQNQQPATGAQGQTGTEGQ